MSSRAPWSRGFDLLDRDPVAAEALLAVSVAETPESFDAQLAWGAALSRLGRSVEAAGAYRNAARLRPWSEEAATLWAIHEQQAGHLEAAIVAWKAAALANPSRADAWLSVAILADSLGDSAQALEARRMLARGQPSRPEAQAELAIALSRAGDHVEAVRLFHRAETIEPGFLAQDPVIREAYALSLDRSRRCTD